MKKYKITLDKTVSNFFEEISIIVQRPVEDILSDALSKQVEIISRKVNEPFKIGLDDKNEF